MKRDRERNRTDPDGFRCGELQTSFMGREKEKEKEAGSEQSR